MFPPLVLFGLPVPDGEIGSFRMEHYEERAKHNVGTIVVEAAAVSRDYAITHGQIGIWSDEHIAELSELAGRINKHGAISVIQLQHAGGKPLKELNENPFGPSAMKYVGHDMREASKAELENACGEFITAAARAKKAGFHGVEIHNAHGYLLTQMVSPLINKREDKYGGSPENRMKLPLDILKGIRRECGEDFIIGVRFGVNEPSYDDGIFIAQTYENNGIDYLSASHGYLFPGRKEFDVPEDFPNNAVVYGGKLIKDNVKRAPVILVNEIKSIRQGEWLLEHNCGDMIAFGRSLFASPDMITRFNNGEPENDCMYCKSCSYSRNPALCAGRKKRGKNL
jgi:2,4-dienoyl-CoA reductase-like NADH-dependent reductase (Old Yellow Enzyme family)